MKGVIALPLYDLPLIKYYQLHKMIFDIRNSAELKENYLKDPGSVMSYYGIREEEKEILRRGDPIEMYRVGIYPYLLHYHWIALSNGAKEGIEGLQLFKSDHEDEKVSDETHE